MLGRLNAEDDLEGEITHPLDRSLLAALADLVERTTGDFEQYDAARALERVEKFFWFFTDNYLELVKGIFSRGLAR